MQAPQPAEVGTASPPVSLPAERSPQVDHVFAQISAWVDGEADGELPSILATPHGREAWDTYHLIGDTLRSGDLALPAGAAFQARLMQAIEAEPTITAAPVPAGRHRLRVILSSLAVAAAVATVAWMVQPYLSSAPQDKPAVADAASADATSSASIDETSLRDYLDAHRQIAGPSAVRQASFDVGTSH